MVIPPLHDDDDRIIIYPTLLHYDPIAINKSCVAQDYDKSTSAADSKSQSSLTSLVTSVCLEQLLPMQQYIITNKINDNRDLESLCAIINDASRMYDHCDHWSTTTTTTTTGFLTLSLHATQSLARTICHNLHPLLSSHVLTPAWERGDIDPVGTALRYLDEESNQIREWIPAYHFGKCVRHVFDNLVQCYLNVWFDGESGSAAAGVTGSRQRQQWRRIHQNRRRHVVFDDVARASQSLTNDRLAIRDYFGPNSNNTSGSGDDRGFLPDVADRLILLKSMSSLLSCTDAEDAHEDIAIMVRELGLDDGIDAVRRLLRRRRLSGGLKEGLERVIETVWDVKRVRDDEDDTVRRMMAEKTRYNVPKSTSGGKKMRRRKMSFNSLFSGVKTTKKGAVVEGGSSIASNDKGDDDDGSSIDRGSDTADYATVSSSGAGSVSDSTASKTSKWTLSTPKFMKQWGNNNTASATEIMMNTSPRVDQVSVGGGGGGGSLSLSRIQNAAKKMAGTGRVKVKLEFD